MFPLRTSFNIARGLLTRRHPAYVQFYVTARCNLTCKQCNIIYANADVQEVTLEQVERMADNLATLGTGIVLLTGGEPFVRKDLPQIIGAFTRRGIHVRTQTNGLATEAQLQAAVENGAKDISISLDSLLGEKQDFLNGSHDRSWMRAIQTIARVTQIYPARNSFAAFGTVLSPQNLLEIPNIIRFATRIGWHVSLVPAHIADPAQPFNFRSYDREMVFPTSFYPLLDEVLDECAALKKQGFHLYDSAEYLDDIKRFVKGEGIRWRRRNDNVCDSPNLYFAIRPNGDLEVCCDHILGNSYPTWHEDFPKWYRDGTIQSEVHPIAKACSGCMYGSFPEISITAHYPMTTLERAGVFFSRSKQPKPWPLTTEQLLGFIDEINTAHPVDHARTASLLEHVTRHADVTRRPLPVLK
jgi:MoaA/NifB/PqqE/SkfB family radical SAM enzyme